MRTPDLRNSHFDPGKRFARESDDKNLRGIFFSREIAGDFEENIVFMTLAMWRKLIIPLFELAPGTHFLYLSASNELRTILSSAEKYFMGDVRLHADCVTDAKKEAFVIPEAIGDPLDYLDLFVHTFKNTGAQMVSGIRQQALHMNGYILGKCDQCLDDAFDHDAVPLRPPGTSPLCQDSCRVDGTETEELPPREKPVGAEIGA